MTSNPLANLVSDVYHLIDNGKKDIKEEDIAALGQTLAKIVVSSLTNTRDEQGNSYLRVSNLGKPLCQLWFDIKGTHKKQQPSASDKIRFLYGHLLEDILLFLVEQAGYKVTDQQKQVNIDGVKGHMDCKINGEVVDVKSASGKSFNFKFKDGRLVEDDPFGYVTQISAYSTHEGKDQGHFLAINKSTGELALLTIDEMEFTDVPSRIKECRDVLSSDRKPSRCFGDVPAGKSGNKKLGTECTFCDHKWECWENLRAFQYSWGTEYLTEVNKLPRVDEVTEDAKTQ